MALRYTVVCDTLSFLGYDLLEEPKEILQTIKNAGYDGADLPGDPNRANGKELRNLVDSIGLEVPEVLGAWAYFHGGEDRDLAGDDEEARQRGINYANKMLDYSVQVGARFFSICAAQPPIYQVPFPKLPIQTLRQNFMNALKEICQHANKCGLTILLEPLNCYEAYPGVLTTVYEALSIIKEMGVDNIGIQPDVFHMNVGEASIADSIRTAGKSVRHVHINETNHRELGTGHADYTAVIKALRDINYDGYLAVYMPYTTQEIFNLVGFGYGQTDGSGSNEKVKKTDLKAYLEKPLKYLKEIESVVEMGSKIYTTN